MSALTVWSNHPSEGELDLSVILKEALSSHPEIQTAEKELDLVLSKYRHFTNSFLPELNFENEFAIKKPRENDSGTNFASYLSLSSNLFRGGYDFHTQKLQELEIKSSEVKLQQVRAEVIEEVKQLYFDLLYLTEAIDLKKRALRDNDALRKVAFKKKQSGFESESDFLEFELREATILSDLIELEGDEFQKGIELFEILKISENERVKNLESHQKNLIVKGHLSKSYKILEIPSLQKVLENAESEFFERMLFQVELEKMDLLRKQIQTEYVPSIKFETNVGKMTGGNLSFSPQDYQMGLKISFPLWSGFSTRDKLKVNHFETQALNAKKSALATSLKIEVGKILHEISQTQKRILLEEKNKERSEKYYQLVLSEYRRGVKSSSDAVSASERLFEAKMRSLEYHKKLAQLCAQFESKGNLKKTFCLI